MTTITTTKTKWLLCEDENVSLKKGGEERVFVLFLKKEKRKKIEEGEEETFFFVWLPSLGG